MCFVDMPVLGERLWQNVLGLLSFSLSLLHFPVSFLFLFVSLSAFLLPPCEIYLSIHLFQSFVWLSRYIRWKIAFSVFIFHPSYLPSSTLCHRLKTFPLPVFRSILFVLVVFFKAFSYSKICLLKMFCFFRSPCYLPLDILPPSGPISCPFPFSAFPNRRSHFYLVSSFTASRMVCPKNIALSSSLMRSVTWECGSIYSTGCKRLTCWGILHAEVTATCLGKWLYIKNKQVNILFLTSRFNCWPSYIYPGALRIPFFPYPHETAWRSLFNTEIPPPQMNLPSCFPNILYYNNVTSSFPSLKSMLKNWSLLSALHVNLSF